MADETELTTQTTDEPAAEVAAPEVDEAPKPDPFDEGLKAAAEQGFGAVEEPKAKAEPEGEPETTEPKAEAKTDEKGDEPDEAIEAEIAERGLKGKSADRFRDLANKAKQFDEVRPLAEAAIARAREWEDTVASTGATPEQFGQALGLLALSNSGDPIKMRQAYDALEEIRVQWAQRLGIAAGDVDPLIEHPDLAEAVGQGDITKKHALELAEARRMRALQNERAQEQTADFQHRQAVQAGAQAVTALGNELAASDPHYRAKLPVLMPILEAVRDAYPPNEWPERIRAAYAKIPNPVAAPAPRPPVGASPVRLGTVPSAGQTPKITSANAFDIGLKVAAERGYGGAS